MAIEHLVDVTFYPVVIAACAAWIAIQQYSRATGLLLIIFQTLIIKRLTGRTRPDGSTSDSFPSTHTAVAAYVSFCSPLMVFWAAAIAWSRVKLLRHHPSDVAAGGLLGFATAAVAASGILQ